MMKRATPATLAVTFLHVLESEAEQVVQTIVPFLKS
jgi:hypothetical protein